jgi:uncharacterized protein DUF6065
VNGEGHNASPDELIAFFAGPEALQVEVAVGERRRDWIEAMADRWGNRCLPLLIANESGWILRNPVAFTAQWSGLDHPNAITIDVRERPGLPTLVQSHFGYGILTWGVPFLFRTPPGVNLLARGPANHPKDGIAPLEGVVETDWAVATFTMNWKFTRAHHEVSFDEGEPFCMIVPQRRGELESFSPRLLRFSEDLKADVRRWSERRHETQKRKFLAEFSGEFKDDWKSWERDYFQGRFPDGSQVPEHQTKLRLREFQVPPDD